MILSISARAEFDLMRIKQFLDMTNPFSASEVLEELFERIQILKTQPEIGKKMTEFNPINMRRIVFGEYDVRYVVAGKAIRIVRVWHTREYR